MTYKVGDLVIAYITKELNGLAIVHTEYPDVKLTADKIPVRFVNFKRYSSAEDSHYVKLDLVHLPTKLELALL